MNEIKAVACSWGRAFLGAVLALYIAGVTDPKALLAAGAGALAPVILRWLNPKDQTFGLKK
jgi:hypothetical protein